MKEKLFVLNIILIMFLGSISIAEEINKYDCITGITGAQKQQILRAEQNFKIQSDALEQRISIYNKKLDNLEAKDYTSEEYNKMETAYRNNLRTLRAERDRLKIDTDKKIQAVLSEEQYREYKESKLKKINPAMRQFIISE